MECLPRNRCQLPWNPGVLRHLERDPTLEIAHSDTAATKFFGRRRTVMELRRIRKEIYAPHLLEATREATGYKLDHLQRLRATANRQEKAAAAQHVARLIASLGLDQRTRAALPLTRLHPTGPRTTAKNERAARRFFARIEGQDLSHEATGYRRWAQAAVFAQWCAAPVDPITPGEAATLGTKAGRGKRRPYMKGDIRPVGLTVQRAIEIAHAAHQAVANGTAPTYE